MIGADDRNQWQLRERLLDVSRGVLMGVVNVTSDSFSDGGVNLLASDAIATAHDLHNAGAEIIDVGGESTRPGSEPVSASEELQRVLPVVTNLSEEGLVVSIDTTKPAVAEAAIDAGAQIVNDVTSCSTPGMAELVAGTGVGVVLMHSKGPPKTMQESPSYEDVVEEVAGYLRSRVGMLLKNGVDASAIAIDPGIGFGKTVAHNLELIGSLEVIAGLGRPVVLGASRKSFLGVITGIETPADRDGPTAVTTALGYERGARVFRVHDVVSSRAALAVTGAIVAPQRWDEWLQG